MLKICAAAALALSVSAFLLESHTLIWLVAAVLPGAVAVLRGGRKVDVAACSASADTRARPAAAAALSPCDGRTR